jgi:hypothetical protein
MGLKIYLKTIVKVTQEMKEFKETVLKVSLSFPSVNRLQLWVCSFWQAGLFCTYKNIWLSKMCFGQVHS